jgi:hypothetical protein
MQSIDVRADGQKVYKVVTDMPMPGATKKARDPKTAKYPFNEMAVGSGFIVGSSEERTRVTAAFASDVYAPARERGRIKTKVYPKGTPGTPDFPNLGDGNHYAVMLVEHKAPATDSETVKA